MSFLKDLPAAPGVYKMLDESRTILYIGKAGNLKKKSFIVLYKI